MRVPSSTNLKEEPETCHYKARKAAPTIRAMPSSVLSQLFLLVHSGCAEPQSLLLCMKVLKNLLQESILLRTWIGSHKDFPSKETDADDVEQ